METKAMTGWGTWEELLLGGAVLRHGIRDWNVVAAELRARTVCPYSFTPEACKAKYEDLQQRYSGCTAALFEALRKQRMAGLRRALELSEDSIGSLESKLETLKAETGDDYHVDYDSSQTESLVPLQKSEGFESSSKQISKDGLSAGSFTQETQTNWSPECQIPAAVPVEEMGTKPECSHSFQREKVSSIDELAETICGGQIGSLRKKRGKRKRKDCSKNVKEGSVGESDFLCSADVVITSLCKENSTSDSSHIARSSDVDDQSRGLSKDGIDVLMRIYNSVAQNESASAFRHRLDSQKRGRYKKMIRRHMDFDTLRSRIASHSMVSAKELFRDLLLLANNALVFYSKSTREHKSAVLLRDFVTKTLWQHLKDCASKPTDAIISFTSTICKPPAKPRSVRGGNPKLSGKMTNANNVVARTSNGVKKPSDTDSPHSVESLSVAKKGFCWPRKVRRGGASRRHETTIKARKRIHAR